MSRPRSHRTPFGATLLLLLAAPALALELPDVRKIFQRPLVEGTRPTAGKISPDGRWVAYFWNAEGHSRPLNLYLVPATGGEPRRVSAFVSRRPERENPSWPMPGPGAFIEFSPESQRILFGYDGDLYVAAVEGDRLDRLTRTDTGEGEASWSPDGRAIVYASGGAIFRLNYPGPGILQLTSPEKGFSHSTPRWSPDGRKILFLEDQPKDQKDFLVPYYLDEWVTTRSFKRGYSQTRVGVVSPEGGKPLWVEAGKEPIGWLNEVRWSPDGGRILLDHVSKDYKSRTLAVTDGDLSPPRWEPPPPEEEPAVSPPPKRKDRTVPARVLYTETDPRWVYDYDGFVTDTTSSSFSPDGSRILFTSEKSGFNQVHVVTVTGGKPRRVTRFDGAVDWAAWLPRGDRILVLGYDGNPARRSLYVVPARGGAAERIQAQSTYVTHPFLGPGGGKVLYEGSELGVPFDYFIADAESMTSLKVSDTVPRSFREVELPVPLAEGSTTPSKGWVLPRIVSFPSRDGKTLKGLLYEPPPRELPALAPSLSKDRHPVVVFVHGAGIQQNVVEGWSQYSPNFKFATVLANHGFVVFEVDYRGSSGYGREFRTGVAGHLGGKDLEDELAGVDFLKTLPFVDPERIGIYGGSYGGFMAEMALFRAPEAFAAGAALRPVADWANYYRSNSQYCVQRLGTLEEHPEAYRRSSPINFSGGLEDPLLLLHGVLDSNVPFQDTVQLTDRLLRQGKIFELMIYPREDHGFTEPENWIDQYSRILDFFERHLKR